MKIAKRRAVDSASRKPRSSLKGAKLVYISVFLMLCLWWFLFLYSTNGALLFNHFLAMKYKQALHATTDATDSIISTSSEGLESELSSEGLVSERLEKTVAATLVGLKPVAPSFR